jgi:hypothetical protein
MFGRQHYFNAVGGQFRWQVNEYGTSTEEDGSTRKILYHCHFAYRTSRTDCWYKII